MAVPEGGPAGRQKTEDRGQETSGSGMRRRSRGGFPAFLYFSVFFVSGNYADILRVSEKELQQECGARTVVSHPGDAACFFSGECMRETICLPGTVFWGLSSVFRMVVGGCLRRGTTERKDVCSFFPCERRKPGRHLMFVLSMFCGTEFWFRGVHLRDWCVVRIYNVRGRM